VIGATVAGRWRVVAPVGAGAVGAVWVAEDLQLGRRVALKILHAELAARPQAAERFRREALALARLRHPHAVHVYDHGDDGGRLWIAMELIEGTPLDALARAEGGRLAPARAVALLAPVLEVLEHAHGLGLVHRDLKPANVIVARAPDGAERPMVVDFGLAVLLDGGGDGDGAARLTLKGQMHGTPAYMPPEQCLGRAVDARSDLYAVGCCLYELLAGAPPFGDGDPAQVIAAQIHAVPVAPRRLEPPVVLPEALEEVLLASLAKLPSRRPESARAMREALLAAIAADGAERREAARGARRPRGEAAGAAAEGGGAGGAARAVGIVEAPGAAQGVATALSVAGFAVEALGSGFAGAGAGAELGAVVVVPSDAADPVAAAARWVRAGGPPVLLCGPEADVALMARAIEAGLYDFVALPLDAAELVRKVKRALEVRR